MKPLHIWMHPRQAARRISQLEQDLEQLRLTHEDTLQEHRRHADTLTQEAAGARGQASRAFGQLEQLRRKYDSLKKQIAEERRRQTTLFTDRDNDIQQMKASYERRLEHLRHALADAQALLADRTDYDALRQMTMIDMTAPASPAPAPIPAPPAAPAAPAPPAKDADWLEPLPD